MVTVNPGPSEYYLFRKSGATTEISCGVLGDSASGSISRALGGLSGMGGISVIMKNKSNSANSIETITGTEGELLFDSVIPRDEYSLEIPVQTGVSETVIVPVTPVYDGENIGFITLTDADQNFKVSYSLSAGDEWGYHYTGESYNLELTIKNIGTEDMLSADYEVTPPDGISLTGTRLADILGTVQANGGEESLVFSLYINPFTEDYKDFDIPISIYSVDGEHQWDDQISLRVFRETMSLHVKSETQEVQGVVISPDARSFPLQTSGLSGSITLPARESGYVLALSGAGYNTETRYALKINSAPLGNGSSLTSTRINEPNNDETQGTGAFWAEEYQGYLGVYDLDFYRICNSLKPTSPTVAVSPLTSENSPEWTWNDIPGVETYRIRFIPDSDWLTPTETSYTPSEPLDDGFHTLYVQGQDISGEWTESGSATTEVDTRPPDVPLVTSDSPSTDTTPSWQWTGSEGVTSFRYSLSGVIGWTETVETSFTSLQELSPQLYTLYVQAQDEAGNWSTSGSCNVRIGIEAPVVSVESQTNNPSPTWSWSAPDGVQEYRYSYLENSDWTPLTDRAFTPPNPLADGEYTLYVQARDILSNWSVSGTGTVLIDTTPPSGSLSLEKSTVSEPRWSWSGISDAAKFRFSFTDGSGWSETQENFYLHTDILTDGSHTLYVQAGDGSDNWTDSFILEIEIDSTAPSSPNITRGSSPIDSPIWSWIMDSDAVESRYSFNGISGWTLTTAQAYAPGTILADGIYTLYVQVRDEAGNWSISAEAAPMEIIHLGSSYAGGIVFYIDGNGGGMVVAEENQAEDVLWGGQTATYDENGIPIDISEGILVGETSTAFGSGSTNTTRIISRIGTASAAGYCYDLSLNGYSDWYLPSKEELQLALQIASIIQKTCWSSSEYNNGNAWECQYSPTYSWQQYLSKINLRDVRAVRSF
ncbi:MAG: hypothetical protein JEY99_14265 [Spirochaetales bacterium]|nr:hypothetical protein [Spirochaetales bacterium]